MGRPMQRATRAAGRRPECMEDPCATSPADRPRERLFLFGEDDLSDAECLSLVVGNVASRPSLEVAEQLIVGFGGLRALQRADGWELVRRGKLGIAGAQR